jgi:hypothetical protein
MFLLLLLTALALGGCAEPPYSNIDNAQLRTLPARGVQVYDIRRPEEWRQTGVVEGSRKLTFVDAGGRPNPESLPRFTAAMNYVLATWIVVSPAGTPAFNEELGRLTLLSYPMIALPSMLIMMMALYYLARSIRELAGLKLADALKQQHSS